MEEDCDVNEFVIYTAPATCSSEADDPEASPEPVAPDVATPAKAIKEWIIGTGTGNHLVAADR